MIPASSSLRGECYWNRDLCLDVPSLVYLLPSCSHIALINMFLPDEPKKYFIKYRVTIHRMNHSSQLRSKKYDGSCNIISHTYKIQYNLNLQTRNNNGGLFYTCIH